MLTNSKFSFVKFDGSDDPLPYYDVGDVAFQIFSSEDILSVRMLSMYGETIEDVTYIIIDVPVENGKVFFIYPQFSQSPDCFRIALIGKNGVIAESNTFVKLKNDKFTSQLRYRCDENQFNFVYCPPFIFNSVRLPFYLKNPQFPQNQTVYIEKSGRRRVTSATIGKEYQLETDYLPEWTHEKIVISLSHDVIFIDGKFLTKSGDYNIDWGNYRTIEGVKEAKATCMMTENVVSRNSNCGLTCTGKDFEVWPLSLTFYGGIYATTFDVNPLSLIFEAS